MTWTYDLDSTTGDVGLLDRHGTPQVKCVGANLARIEPQALEDNLGGMEAEEGDYVSDGDGFRKRAIGEKIGVDGGVRIGLV